MLGRQTVINWLRDNIPLLGDPECYWRGSYDDIGDDLVVITCPCVHVGHLRKEICVRKSEVLTRHIETDNHVECTCCVWEGWGGGGGGRRLAPV